MPTTISIVDHPAKEWTQSKIDTPESLIRAACPEPYSRCQRMVQSSFTNSELQRSHVSASKNGFVWAAYHAYSEHYHLIIRPEDVWFAILTQLSFHINANAEQLRNFFVQHTGQQELMAVSHVANFGALAVQMTGLIAKNVVDPALREWVMPSFTTTTATDRVVAAILFMGAMQKYFSYRMVVDCGLPSITLLGEVEDWKEILKRLDKIDLLGEEPQRFAAMLRPVLQHMILSFEDPTSTDVATFWNTIVHRTRGSGTDYLSGWLTAFCFWDADGKAKTRSMHYEFSGDVAFPTVKTKTVPAGFAFVPVEVDDNGNLYSATMVAGSVGIAALTQNASSTALRISSVLNEQQNPVDGATVDTSPNEAVRDTVQPVSGWWMLENETPEQAEAREAERKGVQNKRSHYWDPIEASRRAKRAFFPQRSTATV